MVSRVLAATPPSVPAVGDGRIKARASAASCALRVLSARIQPPVPAEDGSTARTATLVPSPGSGLAAARAIEHQFNYPNLLPSCGSQESTHFLRGFLYRDDPS